MAKTYTGIDIGDHALKVAVSDGASIKLMAVEVVPDGMVANGRIVSFDAMADFIKVLPSKYKGLDKNVGELCYPLHTGAVYDREGACAQFAL